MKLDNTLCIRSDRRESDDELIAQLHHDGYKKLGPRFGAPFDAYVVQTLEEANLAQRWLDADDRSRVWFAELNGKPIGCAALVDRGERAQLRWVVVLDEARGLGAGRKLLNQVLNFASQHNFKSIYLETIDDLTLSMTLYETSGFALVSKKQMQLWYGEDGCEVVMEKMLS